MKASSILFAGVLSLGLTAAAHADDKRPSHFKGEPADTLTAAVTNFSEYNKKLAAILAKDNLAPEDLVKVHELTYTLENALKKLEDELDDLADTLEEVHEASERLDGKTVKEQGQKYLDTARQIIQ